MGQQKRLATYERTDSSPSEEKGKANKSLQQNSKIKIDAQVSDQSLASLRGQTACFRWGWQTAQNSEDFQNNFNQKPRQFAF
jgi:hypothetical protein